MFQTHIMIMKGGFQMNYIAVSLGVIVVAFVLFFSLSFKDVNLFAHGFALYGPLLQW